MLRYAVCLSLTFFLVGCGEPIANLDQPKDANNNAVANSEAPPPETASSSPMTEQATTETPSEEKPPEEPAPEPKPKKGVIHQTTDEVVDAKEWLKKQGIEARDGNIEGVDPFSQAASGYFTLAARASTLGLQQQVQHYKALNGKFPSYKEFMQMMRDNRIEFAKLRWYEIYGYNEDTGKILVLVDTVAKEEGP
ncbi:hypothetical protein Pan97_51130 [Bremerella volcania]|uniref:Uncharacterized protein n=1 Tax=Bremerella volcania TaxID=2527984 RepID=A0A518CFM9_9BACT|nr:hypothetical protein [Bremerella volcania]QDU78033.1 hypothetical protein Pan97_51130 [Bremerella volcania]